MDADLDTLCTVIYCTADDLLPEAKGQRAAPGHRRRAGHALRRPGDHGHPLRPPLPARWRASASATSSRMLPSQSGYYKRRRRLADAIEWLLGVFAAQSPGFATTCCSSTRPRCECARSRETVKRSALGEAAGYGYCAAHSRCFWGFRLHLLAAPDGTPRALRRSPIPQRDEREVGARAARALRRARRRGAGLRQGLRRARVRRGGRRARASSWCARRARTSPTAAPTWRPSASASSRSSGPARTCSRLERHGARTLAGLRERILQRFLCLAACISLNHRLGRPSRALVDYCA